MSTLKLWYSAGACSLVPHALLHEIGADFEAIPVALREGAHMSADFARINPKRRVPVLSVDGKIVTEMPAILAAIAELVPERDLTGRTPSERATVREWLAWLSGTLHGQGFAGLWRPGRFSDDVAAHDGIRSRGRDTILDCLETIEGRLTDEWAVGDAFTVVDLNLLVFYRWGNGVGVDMVGRHPNYTRLARSLVARIPVAEMLRVEGLDAHPLNDPHVPGVMPKT